MALPIPKHHLAVITKIKQLSDVAADQLITALGSFPPTPEADTMSKQISSMVSVLEPKELKQIIETVYALYYVREVSASSPAKFLNDLIQTFKNSTDLDLTISDPGEISRVRDRFKRLLGIENIGLLSKAMRLQRDGERLYCEAKILSDMRAVFHDDAISKPVGAVVTHTLKLGYHEKGSHKEFFVVLESADLEALKEIIERTQAKETILRKLLPEAGLQDLSL